MSKKTIFILLTIFIIIVCGILYFTYKQDQFKNKTQVSSVIKLTGKTNNFENSELFRIARKYILSKPRLSSGPGVSVDWNKVSGFASATPEWITSHTPTIEYVTPRKYETPYSYLNDKYTVDWFFIPGCEEDINSNNRPNWFRNGLPCLGGNILRVIINPNGTVDRTELDSVK